MKLSAYEAQVARRIAWLAAAIIALVPFQGLLTAWAASDFGHYDLWKVWKEILLLIMVLPALWLALRRPPLRRWLLHSWIVRLYILYVLLHLVLGWWALSHHQVNRTALAFALIINLRFIGFFIICAIASACSSLLRDNWPKLLLIPAAIVILFGIFQEFVLPINFLKHFGYGPDTLPLYQTVDRNLNFRRLMSTLRGSDPLGAYLVLIIPSILLFLRKNRTLQIGLLLAAIEVLYYSYSRSAWIGAALAFGLAAGWTAARKPRLRPLVAGGLVALAIIAGGFYLLRDNTATQTVLLHTSSSSTSKDSSNQAHLRALKSGASDIYHQPLGRGPGTAGPASARNDHPARIAEDYYLQIGQEVGIIGMALFLAIYGLVAWQLWSRRTERLSMLLLVSLVGISFVNLLSHAWTDDTLSYIWWGLAGLALAPRPPVRNRHYGRPDILEGKGQVKHGIIQETAA